MAEYPKINVGAEPNDGGGDPIRDAGIKINSMFDRLAAKNTIKTSSFTLHLEDSWKYIICNNIESDINITIPNSDDFEVDSSCIITKTAGSNVNLIAGEDVTISGVLNLSSSEGILFLKYLGSSVWYVREFTDSSINFADIITNDANITSNYHNKHFFVDKATPVELTIMYSDWKVGQHTTIIQFGDGQIILIPQNANVKLPDNIISGGIMLPMMLVCYKIEGGDKYFYVVGGIE